MGSSSAAKHRHSGHHSPAKYSATWRPAKRLHSTRAPLWFRTEAPENRHCCGCVGAAKVDSRHNIARRPRRDRRRSGRLAALPKRSQRRREALRARPRASPDASRASSVRLRDAPSRQVRKPGLKTHGRIPQWGQNAERLTTRIRPRKKQFHTPHVIHYLVRFTVDGATGRTRQARRALYSTLKGVGKVKLKQAASPFGRIGPSPATHARPLVARPWRGASGAGACAGRVSGRVSGRARTERMMGRLSSVPTSGMLRRKPRAIGKKSLRVRGRARVRVRVRVRVRGSRVRSIRSRCGLCAPE